MHRDFGGRGRPIRADAVPPCDFCSSTVARWLYHAPDAEIGIVGCEQAAVMISVGGWFACDGCLTPIQRGDLTGLVERVAAGFVAEVAGLPVSLETVREWLTVWYGRLLPSLDPPVPVTSDLAERWRRGMARWQPGDEASARRVAEAVRNPYAYGKQSAS